MRLFLRDLLLVAILKARAGAPYLTPAKVLNAARCELHKRRRLCRPDSYPYIAIVDAVNTCNLHCLYCPTGLRRSSGRSKRIIDPSLVAKLIDEAGRHLIAAHLYNWGEPLLHPRINTIVGAFHSRGIATFISTNLSVNNGAVLDTLCDAGLDYLTVSLSGATQEVYARYHRGGKLDRVVANTRRLVDYKRRHRLRRPFIEWKYLVFRHNLHEVNSARKLASATGVDLFRAVRAGGPDQAVVPTGEVSERKLRAGYCPQLWHALVVNSDGGIAPCCYLFFKEDDFVELCDGSIAEIRRNDPFVTGRKLFNPSCVAELPADIRHPCLECDLVHSQPHLSDYLSANPHAVQDHRTGGP